MAPQITVAKLLERNKAHVQSKPDPIPYLSEGPALGLSPPHILLIACTDPRCIPENFLRLETGDILVMRNIAGHPQPGLEQIVALDAFLGLTDIMVVHHTDCGATHFVDQTIRDILTERLPQERGEIEKWGGWEIHNVEESLKKDVTFLRSSPFIRKELGERSHGYIYDIKDGSLTKLDV